MKNLRLSPRLYIPQGLSAQTECTPNKEQSHYLLNVMRLKLGDDVRLFNEKDGEWHAQVAILSKREIRLIIRERLRAPQQPPDLWLCCAPIKKAHFEYMIEKATELGVSVIQPLLTSRTQIREINQERLTAITIESAEQSERLTIPKVEPARSVKDFLNHWSSEYFTIVCAELGPASPLGEILKHTTCNNHQKTAIVTGPEGGFTEEELLQFQQIPNAVMVRLGPRVLRADTAALAALSLWQGLAGDWINTSTPVN